MRKIAFTFPGQGSQSIGMGISLAERFAAARDLFDRASGVLGWDLWKVCKEGPEEKLRETDVAQPALYVTGYAAAMVLQQAGVTPQAVAGHSIGEYSALATAGVFTFDDGLSLVQQRGRLMAEAATARPGAMVAVLGLTEQLATSVCAQASGIGVCVPVNFNSPEQIVIAGEASAIERVVTLATEKGAKRVIKLNVAGAFHSPLMKSAADAMRAALSKVPFADALIPVAMNVDGAMHSSGTDIFEGLAKQLDHPVQWVRTIETLRGEGYNVFIECGPGRVLSGLLRRIDKGLEAFSTESAEAATEVGEVLSASRRTNA